MGRLVQICIYTQHPKKDLPPKGKREGGMLLPRERKKEKEILVVGISFSLTNTFTTEGGGCFVVNQKGLG